VLFKPDTGFDAAKLTSHKDIELKAEIVGMNQEIQATIQAEVYCSRSGAPYWGSGLSEPFADGQLEHLMIIDHLCFPEHGDKTDIVFWITPNELLTPSMHCSTFYTGEITRERLDNVEFLIEDGVRLVFDQHFKTKEIDSGELVQWSYLVACAELATPAADLEVLRSTVLPNLDDFLLIASLAAGKRTACLGWTATDQHCRATYYRGNFAFPDRDAKCHFYDGVAEHQSAEEFIDTCYANFLAHNDQLALRSAICAVVPLRKHTIEADFLSNFAGLETLLLSFRRQAKLEHILSSEEWEKLRESLEKCIRKSTDPRLESEQRAFVYNKFDELNRVSTRDAFDIFCRHYEIGLLDLWPVFGNKKAIGLVDIRNKLIHGDPFPNEFVDALGIANIHLQITLKRALVRVLGWDIARTYVNSGCLGYYFTKGVTDFSHKRKRLTEYIYG
jgi:hypothetical protein